MRDMAGLMSQKCDYPSLTRDWGGYSALVIELARDEVETKFELLSLAWCMFLCFEWG